MRVTPYTSIPVVLSAHPRKNFTMEQKFCWPISGRPSVRFDNNIPVRYGSIPNDCLIENLLPVSSKWPVW